jgi:hypothetical protein
MEEETAMPRVQQNRIARNNHIVEYTLAGKQNQIDETARLNFLRDHRSKELFTDPDGVLIPFSAIPPLDGTILRASRHYPHSPESAAARVLTVPRMVAILSGATPTAEETMAFQLAWIAAVTNDPTVLDNDEYPAYCGFGIRHSDGRIAFALYLVSGYTRPQLLRRFCGFFASKSDEMAFLDRKGISIPIPIPDQSSE